MSTEGKLAPPGQGRTVPVGPPQPWSPGRQTPFPVTQDYETFDEYMKAVKKWQEQAQMAMRSPEWLSGLNRGERTPTQPAQPTPPPNFTPGGGGGRGPVSGAPPANRFTTDRVPPMRMPEITINLPEIPQYSPTLPGLTAEQEAQFDAMRGAYDEQLKQAENMRAEGLSRLGLDVGQADNRLRRQGYQSGVALRNELSERGLGFSPMFVNRGMRDISGQVAAQRADLQSQRASREEALTRMFQQAEQERNRGIANLELQRSLLQSAPSAGLLGGVR